MSIPVKHNVQSFNQDVCTHGMYLYADTRKFSCVVTNRRITQEILRYLTPDIHTVIDAGCGDGTYTQVAALAAPWITLTGFDPAEDAIRKARASYPGIAFSVGNILEPETLPKEKFDAGILRGVLHHLPVQDQAIAHMRALTDKLLLVEPNGNNPIVKIIERLSPYHREHEEQSFTVKQLVRWCKDAGYASIRVTHIGFVPCFCWEPLARVLYAMQPFLEKIPFVNTYLSAQIVLFCEA